VHRSRNRAEAADNDLTGVLIYPNTRPLATASLGFLKVRAMLESRLGRVDISYLPAKESDSILSPRQGLLLGERTGQEVNRFDLAAFSISYENDYVNLARLLVMAGLAPLSAGRESAFPLVLAGGFTMSMNPLPIADFVDAVVVGEAEAVIDRVVEVLCRSKRDGTAKAELVSRLGKIEGIYIPSLGERPVRRVWAPGAEIAPDPGLPESSHFGRMSLVEAGRGCGRGCLFCAAGNLYRPVRMRSGTVVTGQGERGDRVGLVGTAVGDHPEIVHILSDLVERGVGVGMSSLRADQLSAEVARLLVRGGVRSIAVAPEAGTEALRKRIGKNITEAEIVRAIRILSEAGMRRVKLYFMLGLPGESDSDVEAIVGLAGRLAALRGAMKMEISASPFVPKPHTAFQWYGFTPRKVLRRRQARLRKTAAIKGCTYKPGSVDEAWTEAVLARGDRSLSGPLLKAAESGKALKPLLKKTPGIDPTRELDTAKPLPWDFIDPGVSRKGLLEAYLASKRD
jgi:radical SAM superfamily enzyme YgiQ (UPF0313 family)